MSPTKHTFHLLRQPCHSAGGRRHAFGRRYRISDEPEAGNEVRPRTPMPRTMKTTMISSDNNSSNVTGPPVSLPGSCDNLTDFANHASGLDFKLNARSWDNLTEIDLLARSVTYMLSKNDTCLEHAPVLTNTVYLKVIVLVIMSVLSLICNLATIYSIRRNRSKQRACSTIYTLILHLSVADLLVTIFCMAGEAIWSYNVAWLWGNVTCKMFKFLQMFSLYLSTFVLVLIGVDRFIAVRYPMKGFNMANRCSRFVLLAWMLSFVLATPQVSCAVTLYECFNSRYDNYTFNATRQVRLRYTSLYELHIFIPCAYSYTFRWYRREPKKL